MLESAKVGSWVGKHPVAPGLGFSFKEVFLKLYKERKRSVMKVRNDYSNNKSLFTLFSATELLLVAHFSVIFAKQ